MRQQVKESPMTRSERVVKTGAEEVDQGEIVGLVDVRAALEDPVPGPQGEAVVQAVLEGQLDVLGPALLGRGRVTVEKDPPPLVELPENAEVDEGDDPDVRLLGARPAALEPDGRVADLNRQAGAHLPFRLADEIVPVGQPVGVEHVTPRQRHARSEGVAVEEDLPVDAARSVERERRGEDGDGMAGLPPIAQPDA